MKVYRLNHNKVNTPKSQQDNTRERAVLPPSSLPENKSLCFPQSELSTDSPLVAPPGYPVGGGLSVGRSIKDCGKVSGITHKKLSPSFVKEFTQAGNVSLDTALTLLELSIEQEGGGCSTSAERARPISDDYEIDQEITFKREGEKTPLGGCTSLLDYKRIKCRTQEYNTKVIKTRNVIEVTRYENLQRDNHKNIGGGLRDSKSKNLEGQEKKDHEAIQLLKSERRAKKQVRLYVNANVDYYGKERAKFITETFGDEVRDLKTANHQFTLSVKRINRFVRKVLKDESWKLQYVAVPAFQDGKRKGGKPGGRKGVIHYHVFMFNLPYIRIDTFKRIWGQGFVWMNAINDISNCGAYVVGYMNKELCDSRFYNQKRFFKSQGLIEPLIEKTLTGKEIEPPTGWEIVYQVSHENEYRGKIHYYQFQRKDRPKRVFKKKLDKPKDQE